MDLHTNCRILALPDSCNSQIFASYAPSRDPLGNQVSHYLWNTDQFCIEAIAHGAYHNSYEYIKLSQLSEFAGIAIVPLYYSLAIHINTGNPHEQYSYISILANSYPHIQFVLVFGAIGRSLIHMGVKIPSNITILSLESEYDSHAHSSIPYPSSYHSLENIPLRRPSERSHRLCMVGNFRPGLRGGIMHQLTNQFVDENNVVVGIDTEHYPWLPSVKSLETADAVRLNSRYSLEPPGDSPSRKGIFDAIAAGCVPVLFSPHSYRLPFSSEIDWSSFSLDVYMHGVEFVSPIDGQHYSKISDLLDAIPLDIIEQKYENLLNVRSKFSYKDHAWAMIERCYLDRILSKAAESQTRRLEAAATRAEIHAG
ncbi:exostosin domain-containing protein [Methylobacterium aquaticum]|jgi:hypothetical protein|uniref:exostosin domain-containing protein n=1 Tax=Methylobacterium aquaticum TaxID=270351 RepID=UPI0009E3720F|nr:exostosin family protein [Methylobacterium aquaticum]